MSTSRTMRRCCAPWSRLRRSTSPTPSYATSSTSSPQAARCESEPTLRPAVGHHVQQEPLVWEDLRQRPRAEYPQEFDRTAENRTSLRGRNRPPIRDEVDDLNIVCEQAGPDASRKGGTKSSTAAMAPPARRAGRKQPARVPVAYGVGLTSRDHQRSSSSAVR
jgi:hypothetical protein